MCLVATRYLVKEAREGEMYKKVSEKDKKKKGGGG